MLLACLCTVLLTQTSPGRHPPPQGDLTPKATSERAFAIFAMCIGTGLFGYILSAMTNILSDSFRGDAQVQMKFKALQQFMDAKELPFELKVRIRLQTLEYEEREVKRLLAEAMDLDVDAEVRHLAIF